MLCPHGQDGVNFFDFVQTSFMDGPLRSSFGLVHKLDVLFKRFTR